LQLLVPLRTVGQALQAAVQLLLEIFTHAVPQRCSPAAHAHCALHVPSSHNICPAGHAHWPFTQAD
jgi:hypothetical protein